MTAVPLIFASDWTNKVCESGGHREYDNRSERDKFWRTRGSEESAVKRTCAFKREWYLNGTRDTVTFLLQFFLSRLRKRGLRSDSPSLSLFTMTTPTHCSPSRSSLSCCQFDRSSQDDMRGSATIIGNNNYFLQREKHFFPKRPEVDLSFRDIRYHIKEWSIRNFSSKYDRKRETKTQKYY